VLKKYRAGVPQIRHSKSHIQHPTSDIRHPTSDIRHPPLFSHSKLLQVMIQVFVHSLAPLLRGEFAKHGVGKFTNVRRPLCIKLIDQVLQFSFLFFKIPFIFNDKIRRSGKVFFQGASLYSFDLKAQPINKPNIFRGMGLSLKGTLNAALQCASIWETFILPQPLSVDGVNLFILSIILLYAAVSNKDCM
jgi:hypothetical protein